MLITDYLSSNIRFWILFWFDPFHRARDVLEAFFDRDLACTLACLFFSSDLANFLPQESHVNGFSPAKSGDKWKLSYIGILLVRLWTEWFVLFVKIQIISILVLKSYSETFGGVVSRQLKKVPNPSVFLLYKTDKCPFQRMSFVSSDNYFKNNSLKTINKDESQPNSCCTFWLIPTCVSSDVCCEMVWPTKWSHTYPALERLLACKYLQWVAGTSSGV